VRANSVSTMSGVKRTAEQAGLTSSHDSRDGKKPQPGEFAFYTRCKRVCGNLRVPPGVVNVLKCADAGGGGGGLPEDDDNDVFRLADLEDEFGARGDLGGLDGDAPLRWDDDVGSERGDDDEDDVRPPRPVRTKRRAPAGKSNRRAAADPLDEAASRLVTDAAVGRRAPAKGEMGWVDASLHVAGRGRGGLRQLSD
jgi:hypothetical protein